MHNGYWNASSRVSSLRARANVETGIVRLLTEAPLFRSCRGHWQIFCLGNPASHFNSCKCEILWIHPRAFANVWFACGLVNCHIALGPLEANGSELKRLLPSGGVVWPDNQPSRSRRGSAACNHVMRMCVACQNFMFLRARVHFDFFNANELQVRCCSQHLLVEFGTFSLLSMCICRACA